MKDNIKSSVKKEINWTALIIGIVIITLVIILVVWILRWFFSGLGLFLGRLSGLDAAFLAVAVSIIGIVLNTIMTMAIKILDYRQRIKLETRLKMIAPYEKFMDTFMSAFHVNREIDEDGLAQKMNEISRDLLLYGSNDVIKKWNNIREVALRMSETKEEANRENTINLWAGLIYAIRKDLGLKKKITMREDDIISVFINDAKKLK